MFNSNAAMKAVAPAKYYSLAAAWKTTHARTQCWS